MNGWKEKKKEEKKKSGNRDGGKMSATEGGRGDKGIRELERAERRMRGEKERNGGKKERRIPKMYSELVLPHDTGSSG